MSNDQRLGPQNCLLLLVDRQPHSATEAQSEVWSLHRAITLILAKAAAEFDIPILVSTARTEAFSCLIFPAVLSIDPDLGLLERHPQNSWSDPSFHQLLYRVGTGRRRSIVVAGFWSDLSDFDTLDMTNYASNGHMFPVSQNRTDTEPQRGADRTTNNLHHVTPLSWQDTLLQWHCHAA